MTRHVAPKMFSMHIQTGYLISLQIQTNNIVRHRKTVEILLLLDIRDRVRNIFVWIKK